MLMIHAKQPEVNLRQVFIYTSRKNCEYVNNNSSLWQIRTFKEKKTYKGWRKETGKAQTI